MGMPLVFKVMAKLLTRNRRGLTKEVMTTRYANDLRSMQDMFNGTPDVVPQQQPLALKLASWLEADARSFQTKQDAAAELRRLHAANAYLLAELQNIANANTRDWDDPSDFKAWAQSRARAAIAKATGGSI